ncbi:MAG TPA: alpha-amylase family protein [Opitutaceae bacterium]|nr:alpha-amylase family protein [Opitutaceae bacterium]
MNSCSLRFRQIHLDYHTSPAIPDLGKRFDRARWQKCLQDAAVDSITLFSKCHHGWSYHPTRVGQMHPGLSFDLLRAQYDACKEIGLNVPIYLSAGLDNLASYEHPEWREIAADGAYAGGCRSPLEPGFHKMDFLSPYLDYLCRQIEEVVNLFPDCDGIFLDIVGQYPGCSRWALDFMAKAGLNPRLEADRQRCAEAALTRYYEETNAAARARRADMPVFHNSGHITRGRRDLLVYQSHLELESLPTGGWGYDHFPEGASYAAQLGLSYLGMTGKFHTTWGEFGGLKHPNALRYECAAMLAFGARCSIGDQLHPDAELDASTYEIVGAAYRDVRAKEPWCRDAEPGAQFGVLSSEAEHPETRRRNVPDTGVARVLLEEHQLFQFIDRDSDFGRYDVIVVPDDIRIDQHLETKISAHLARDGKLVLSGQSGLREDLSGFAFDLGAEWHGESAFTPDYVLPAAELRPEFVHTPFVLYPRSQRLRATTGRSLGEVFDPYFNRTLEHFCSHQHAPARREPSGYDAGVLHGNILYFAHPVFSAYRRHGQVICRQFVGACLRRLLKGETWIETNLPSTARVTMTHQAAQRRWIVHLLYATTVNRGGPVAAGGGNTEMSGQSIEVIEELIPLHDVRLSVRIPEHVARITLEPQGAALAFEPHAGRVEMTVPRFECHQMVVLHTRC